MTRGRVTIVDVARRAGVAKSTVSYALNNLPGVSEATRRRVQQAADELGWRPNVVARALSTARADAVGLIMARDPRSVSVEPFFNQLTTGLESELSRHHMSLMIQFVPDLAAEIDAYRAWVAERRVDGVVMVDCRVDDPRLEAVSALSIPAVMLGGPPCDTPLLHLSTGEGVAMRRVVEHLGELGHTRIGWCQGPRIFFHTLDREEAFLQACADLGAEPLIGHGDYTVGGVGPAMAELFDEHDPAHRPTAVIFDNDVMAIAGLGVLAARGLRVPSDVSVVSWEDSMLCTAAFPPLTSLHRDTFGFGVSAVRTLLALIGGSADPAAPVDSHRLVVRASTCRPAAPSDPAAN